MTARNDGISASRIAAFEARLKLQDHRGPDRRDFSLVGKNLVMGHNRLSIIDPTSGNDQPFDSPRSILVFNGEVFNFLQLKSELIGAGYKFSTNGDSEVIALGYEAWGDGIFDKIKGMYAIALYDKIESKLHLARDPFGIKPLYVLESGREIQFSSEMKSIDSSVSINLDGYADLVSFGYHFGTSSLYDGIKSVAPGCRHTYRISGQNLISGYHKDKTLTDILAGRKPPLGVREAVLGSVIDHMISDAPVACALSGGLDSSIVTAIASSHSSNIHAYTNTLFPGGDSETRYSSIVAKHLGTPHHVIETDIDDLACTMRSICYYVEEPIINSAIFNSFYVAKRMKQDGIKVALVGEGSDEMFGGYPWHKLPLTIEDHNVSFDELRQRRAVNVAAPNFVSGRMRKLISEREEVQKDIFLSQMDDSSQSPFNNFLLFDIRHQLQTLQLQRIDRLFMAHGIEARVPFLYDDVLQAALSTLPEHRVSVDGISRIRSDKICLAEAFVGDLPVEVLSRPKFGKGGSVNVAAAPAMKAWPQVADYVSHDNNFKEARDCLDGFVDWPNFSTQEMNRKDQMFVSMLVLGVDAMLNGSNPSWRREALSEMDRES